MSDVFDWSDPEAIKARIAQQVADAQLRATQATAVREEIQNVRERASSRDGSVTVTVDSVGRLMDVAVTESAMRLRPQELSRRILEAAVQAQQQAGQRSVQIAAEAFGADDPAVAHLRGEVDDLPTADLPGGTSIEYR